MNPSVPPVINMPHSFSVIIEWENVKLSGLNRAYKMLFGLGEQIKELGTAGWQPPDLIILYDDQDISREVIMSALNSSMGSTPPPHALKLIPVAGKRYYELKNFGATQTEVDVLVFLDSDVIPESGWLRCSVPLSGQRLTSFVVIPISMYITSMPVPLRYFGFFLCGPWAVVWFAMNGFLPIMSLSAKKFSIHTRFPRV